ncbi:MAG: hypothetical protein ABH883_01695 [Candidatus Omnitrophota bacterium]
MTIISMGDPFLASAIIDQIAVFLKAGKVNADKIEPVQRVLMEDKDWVAEFLRPKVWARVDNDIVPGKVDVEEILKKVLAYLRAEHRRSGTEMSEREFIMRGLLRLTDREAVEIAGTMDDGEKLLIDATAVLPVEYRKNRMDTRVLISALDAAGYGQMALRGFDEKSALVFSEKITFEHGLGVLLPKLVKSGIRVAVIAGNDRERHLIEELNALELEDEGAKIICAENLAEAAATMKGIARFYYFKTDSDVEETIPANVDVVESLLVKQIIEALGKASGLVAEDMIEKLHEAARMFATAA